VIATLALVSCTAARPGYNGKPMDIYAAGPTVSDVRALFNDDNWWQGPPSFEVRPLDGDTIPFTEKFSVSQLFIHIGTAESLAVRYTVYDKTSSATTRMTDLQKAFSGAASTPKVGDQVLYDGLSGSGGAPYVYRTFVRVGQIVVTIVWSRKDTPSTTVKQLARNATKIVDGLKKVLAGKVPASPQPVDSKFLPPAGLDITLLGSATLPIEAWPVMDLLALPGTIVHLFQGFGIADFAYGDYALNNDTHMEVQTSLLTFKNAADANLWAAALSRTKPDASGIASEYIPTSGSPAAGDYHYFFVAGTYGVMMVCKASTSGEAASRECEGPMQNTAIAWRLSLAA
jgi:hypothetical protein